MARVILSAGETYNTANDDTQILGAGGDEQVVILNGVTGASVDGNVERVDFSGAIADYTFSSTGGQLNVFDADGNLVAEISDAGGKQVVFSDGALDVAVDGTGLTVGGEDIPGVDINDPTAPVTPAAIDPAAGEIDDTTTSDAPTFGGDGGDTGGGDGDTLTLTTDVDDVSGTSGDDTFEAPLDGGVLTLNAGDILDGVGGTDRINVQIGSSDGEAIETIASSNIQNWFVRNIDGDGANDETVDMASVSDAEQLWNDRSVTGAELTFVDVQNEVTLGLNDVRAGVTTLDYDLAEDATSQTIAANGTLAQNDVSVTGDAALTATTIDVTADSDIQLMDAGFSAIEDLALTGDADLTLAQESAFAEIQTVDATGLSTDLDLDISGQETTADLSSVELAGGDDRLVVAHDQFVAGNELSIDMGAGANTLATGVADQNEIGDLVFTGADLSINGVNTLELADAVTLSADATLDFDGIAPSGLVFGGDVDFGGNTLDLANTGDTLDIVFEGKVNDGTPGTLDVGPDITTATLTAEGEIGAAAAGVLNIEAAGLTTATINIENDVKIDLGSVTANALETMDINLGDAGDFNGPGAGSLESLATVTVTGGESSVFDQGFGPTEEGLETIDLSAMEGSSDINVTNAGGSDAFGPISVLIGTGDVTYDYASGGDGTSQDRESFTFVGDDIGVIVIDGFEAGVGGTADRLDFSEFAAVTELDDLAITLDSDDTVITAADGEFDGTITVSGVDLSTDAFNFIF